MEQSVKRDEKKSKVKTKVNGTKEKDGATGNNSAVKEPGPNPSAHPGFIKDLAFRKDKNNKGMSSDNDVIEESLPPHIHENLHNLFDEIESQFVQLYNENVKLHNANIALKERLQHFTPEKISEIPENAPNGPEQKALVKAKTGLTSSQFSQKLKTTYRSGTSKLVSSFKTAAAAATCSVSQEFRGHKDGVLHVDSSRLLPLVAGSASADQTAKLWNLCTGHCFGTYRGHTGCINCIRFHPTKQLILTASGDCSVHLWPYESPISSSMMSSADEDVPSDRDEEPLETVDTSASLMRSPCHMSAVVACDWLMDGQHFVTASWDRTACLVDTSTTQVVQTLSGHDQQLTHVSAHPRQKVIVTSSRDATFRVCDFRESTLHSVIVGQGHSHSVTSAVFAQEDKIISGSDDRCVKVWDLKNMRSALATMRLDSQVNRLSVSSRGVIAIPHDNRQVRLYDLSGNRIARLPRERTCHRRMVTSTAWVEGTAQKTKLLTSAWDKLVLGWSVNIPNALLVK